MYNNIVNAFEYALYILMILQYICRILYTFSGILRPFKYSKNLTELLLWYLILCSGKKWVLKCLHSVMARNDSRVIKVMLRTMVCISSYRSSKYQVASHLLSYVLGWLFGFSMNLVVIETQWRVSAVHHDVQN